MWLIFLFGSLLGICVVIISLIIHFIYATGKGNGSGYPGLEDVN